MNLEAFLERLRKTKRDWFVEYGTCIRRRGESCDGRNQCPVTAVAGVQGVYPVVATGMGMGLTRELTLQIAEAADEDRVVEQAELRKKLLEACGIEESK